MDRLPEEIIAMIITHLAADPPNHHHHGNPGAAPPRTTGLAAYAAVSRRWQPRIEALTFAHITLTPARLASPLAARALTPDRVRRLVRSIYLEVLLPPYDEAARRRVEDDAERAANDAVFTDAVRRLFALLAAAGAGEDYRPKIHLSLAARCESDMDDWEGRHRRRPVSPTAPRDLFERRYESSYLDLKLAPPGQPAGSEAEALPEVHCILGFGVQRIDSPLLHYRHFAPRALCLMASRMSGLEQVYWVLRDKEKRDVGLRKKLRAGQSTPRFPLLCVVDLFLFLPRLLWRYLTWYLVTERLSESRTAQDASAHQQASVRRFCRQFAGTAFDAPIISPPVRRAGSKGPLLRTT
jgi:hypothetical protein